MKPFLFLTFCLVPCLTLQGRNFTSNDGQKTLTAEFVRYDKPSDQVTLRLANGRNLVTGAEFFSEADRKFFNQQAREATLGEALEVEADEGSEHYSQKTSQMRIRREKFAYTFTIENRSDHELSDLEVKTWVVVEINRQTKIHKDSTRVARLEARNSQEISGPEFSLTHSARSTCDCPKVKEAAAKMGGDRVIGERIEVRDANGKLLYEDSSSSKVDKALGRD